MARHHTCEVKPKGRETAGRRGRVGERLHNLRDAPQCGSTCPTDKVKWELHRGELLLTGDKSVNNSLAGPELDSVRL